VWEGSGNVAALDVVRVMMREPESLLAFLDECELARGADPRLDAHIAGLRRTLEAGPDEWSTRRLVEDMAVALQASLLVRHSTPAVADAFCASRLAERRATVFGTLPSGAAAEDIIERSLAA
jgi:putative acyl-CoA dehydrogenase